MSQVVVLGLHATKAPREREESPAREALIQFCARDVRWEWPRLFCHDIASSCTSPSPSPSRRHSATKRSSRSERSSDMTRPASRHDGIPSMGSNRLRRDSSMFQILISRLLAFAISGAAPCGTCRELSRFRDLHKQPGAEGREADVVRIPRLINRTHRRPSWRHRSADEGPISRRPARAFSYSPPSPHPPPSEE
jgi:hypothetical protein